MHQLVEYVNKGKFTWNAQLNERFLGLTLSQLKSHEGGKAVHNKRFNQLSQTNSFSRQKHLYDDPEFQEAWKYAKKYWDVPLNEFTISELPEKWDWRNVKGFDFTSPVRD